MRAASVGSWLRVGRAQRSTSPGRSLGRSPGKSLGRRPSAASP